MIPNTAIQVLQGPQKLHGNLVNLTRVPMGAVFSGAPPSNACHQNAHFLNKIPENGQKYKRILIYLHLFNLRLLSELFRIALFLF